MKSSVKNIYRPNILPSILSLDSDTFQANRSQPELPNRPATRLGTDTQRLSASFAPADLRLSLWCPSVVRFGNSRIGGDWGPIFPPQSWTAVTLVPFHTRDCCSQLQEFLSQLQLSLTRALPQRAVCCTAPCNCCRSATEQKHNKKS